MVLCLLFQSSDSIRNLLNLRGLLSFSRLNQAIKKSLDHWISLIFVIGSGDRSQFISPLVVIDVVPMFICLKVVFDRYFALFQWITSFSRYRMRHLITVFVTRKVRDFYCCLTCDMPMSLLVFVVFMLDRIQFGIFHFISEFRKFELFLFDFIENENFVICLPFFCVVFMCINVII